jgi:hypothetical protein
VWVSREPSGQSRRGDVDVVRTGTGSPRRASIRGACRSIRPWRSADTDTAWNQAGPGEQDLYAKTLLQEQGFDGLPHVVSLKQLDLYVQAGEVEVFRGVSAKAHAAQLRTGELYVGRGGLGGGIFASDGADGYLVARAYAQDPGGVVLRMSVKRGARIVDLAELRRQIRADLARGGPTAHVTRRPDALTTLTYYPGTYAAYLGYDAVVDHETAVWLILNRTALRIQEEDLAP